MSDDGLWGKIHHHTKGFEIDWVRIESGMTGSGIPDLNGCKDGVEVWLELKATCAWSVGISSEQVGWAERRIRRGGRVLLATRRRHDGGPRKGPPVDELWLHAGYDIRHVMDHGLQLSPPPLLLSEGGPSRWDWNQFIRLVFRRS